jgi:hypothetical protein
MSRRFHMRRIGSFVFGCLTAAVLAAAPANAEPLRSFFPARDLAQYVAAHWDLGSFDSRLNNAVAPNRRTFASAGLTATAATGDTVTLASDTLRVRITVYYRGDINRDGLEDVSVCYREQAKGKRGETATAFLLTQYSADTPVIALVMPAHSDMDKPTCEARAG